MASELGARAAALVDCIPPLLQSMDPHVRWYAAEVLAVCATGPLAGESAHLVRVLEDSEAPLRRLAIRLLSRISRSQVEAAARVLAKDDWHDAALGILLADASADCIAVESALRDADPVVRRCAAVAALRTGGAGGPAVELLAASDDEDLRSVVES